jgi:transposase InsO family protein
MSGPRPNPARDALVASLRAVGVTMDEATAGRAMRELRLRAWRMRRVSQRLHEEYLEHEKQKGRAAE